MILISQILLALLLAGCSSLPAKDSAAGEQAEILTNKYQVINLQKNFEQFWSVAKGKSFEVQLKSWNETVENPYQDVYDVLVDSKQNNSDWPAKKEKRLRSFFSKIPGHYFAYQKLFMTFDQALERQIEKFTEKFPDTNFKKKIYAIPGATFNGKSGEVGPQKETVLAFGIDIIDEYEDDIEVLFSHELFHLYHLEKLGDNPNSHITLQLWIEGLATYFSYVMNPNKSLEKILMSAELTEVSQKDIRWMARQFYKISDAKTIGGKQLDLAQRWFRFGKTPRKGIPTRAGYLLGFEVVQEIAKKHSLQDMTSWNALRAHQEVKAMLGTLAR